jgi:hypothetical protein
MLLAFGLAIAGIALLILFCCHDPRAFRIDLVIAGVLVILGTLMRMGGRESGTHSVTRKSEEKSP